MQHISHAYWTLGAVKRMPCMSRMEWQMTLRNGCRCSWVHCPAHQEQDKSRILGFVGYFSGCAGLQNWRRPARSLAVWRKGASNRQLPLNTRYSFSAAVLWHNNADSQDDVMSVCTALWAVPNRTIRSTRGSLQSLDQVLWASELLSGNLSHQHIPTIRTTQR